MFGYTCRLASLVFAQSQDQRKGLEIHGGIKGLLNRRIFIQKVLESHPPRAADRTEQQLEGGGGSHLEGEGPSGDS